MYRKQVTVTPGCVGRDFFYHPFNRRVDPNWAKELAANIESVTMSRPDLEFLSIDGKLYILDGQHTITAISNHLDSSRKFDAKIFEADDIDDVHEYLAAKHKGKVWRTADSLYIHKDKSLWPAAAARKGIELSFAVTNRKGFTYSGLINARIAASNTIERGAVIRTDKGRSAVQLLQTWTTQDAPMVERTMDAVAWWLPLATAALAHRNIALFQAEVLGLAIAIFERNSPESLRVTPENFTSDDGLLGLRGVMAFQVLVPRLLHALNYRKQRHLLSLFGETGRFMQKGATP